MDRLRRVSDDNGLQARRVIEAGRKRLVRSADIFARHGDEDLQARELLEYAAGRELDDGDVIAPDVHIKFERLLDRRVTGEPVAYIRGFEEFRRLRLKVKPGAFIPRQSTEFLAEQAIRRLRGRGNPLAADLATGVGAVALAIAQELPKARVYGTDISGSALRLARANARSHGLSNVTFLSGSMFDPLPNDGRGSFDVIASHPPYLAQNEIPDLPKELLQFEPVDSLTDASDDGFGLIRLLVDGAGDWLKSGAWLCIEVASWSPEPNKSRRRQSWNASRSPGWHSSARHIAARS
jgi:release factor glutamine methyltransferase